MNMCLAALSEHHAPFQCFPKRHAFATAHNATIHSEVKHTSQVSAIRKCLCRKAHEYGCMVRVFGEAHKSNIETVKQLVLSENRNVARRAQAFFFGCYHRISSKNSSNIITQSAKRQETGG